VDLHEHATTEAVHTNDVQCHITYCNVTDDRGLNVALITTVEVIEEGPIEDGQLNQGRLRGRIEEDTVHRGRIFRQRGRL